VPKRTGRPWQRRKARIIRRDSGICHLCGQPGADSADHLVPWSHGGPDTDANLAAVHHNVEPYCNRVRGNGTIDAARAKVTAPPNDWDW
jgi:5-methylcytosine-specific restriction endonuclease McrA